MRSVARRVGHAEEKEKKEAKAIRPCCELKQESLSVIVRQTQVRASA